MKRLRTSIAATTLVTALALLACAPSASAADPSLSIAPAAAGVVFGDPVSIGGALTVPAGVSAAGHEVKLYERRYPYKRSKIIATTRTATDGSYEFARVLPRYNSRYRAAVGDDAVAARSASKLVVVSPRTLLRVKATKSSKAVSTLRLEYSSELSLSLDRRKVTWYFHRFGTPRFVSSDRTRAKERKRRAKKILRSRSSFPVPRGDYQFEVTYCIDVPAKRDIGLGAPSSQRGCPKSFRASGRVATERRVGTAAAPVAAASTGG